MESVKECIIGDKDVYWRGKSSIVHRSCMRCTFCSHWEILPAILIQPNVSLYQHAICDQSSPPAQILRSNIKISRIKGKKQISPSVNKVLLHYLHQAPRGNNGWRLSVMPPIYIHFKRVLASAYLPNRQERRFNEFLRLILGDEISRPPRLRNIIKGAEQRAFTRRWVVSGGPDWDGLAGWFESEWGSRWYTQPVPW